MIAYLSGKIIYKHAEYIILDVSGIGYKVYIIPTGNFPLDSKIQVFTYQHIREDRSDLYGFSEYKELEIFETMLSVNGLGPKMALAILSMLSVDEIEKAIATSEAKTFQKAKGVGKKLAAKIILELKSKLDVGDLEKLQADDKADTELIDALVALGYKKNEAVKIASQVPNDLKNIQEKIKYALKH